MKRFAVAGFVAAVLASGAIAQEAPKPGPEHEVLKKMVGDWTLTMKFGGMESKGTVTYKMDLGGLWLSSAMEAELLAKANATSRSGATRISRGGKAVGAKVRKSATHKPRKPHKPMPIPGEEFE